MEESGQWLENVDRTNLVLASGKPVLQKEGKYYYQSLLETRINFGVAELASDSFHFNSLDRWRNCDVDRFS